MAPLHDEAERELAVAPTRDHGAAAAGAPADAPAPAAPAPAGWAAGIIGRHVGKYRVLKQLGQGGMGVVFEAVHESIGQRAAVKVLSPRLSGDPALVERFFNEARAAARVRHAGLVKIFDHGQFPDGTLFILMEFLEGEPLAARLDRLDHKLPLADALRVGRQIASALTAAHELGVVHRDLKPDNVFLVPDDEAPSGERAKVLDFGLARVLEMKSQPGDGVQPRRTSTGTIMGTPAYMAPEQCRGLGQADGQADVYALGIMLYEMLAGRLPFDAEAPGDLIALHLTQEPPPLGELAPEVPPPVAEMIHGMLKKDARERPSMARVAYNLSQIEGNQSGGAALPLSPVVRPPARPRGRAAIAAACLGALLLGGLGLFWLRGRTAQPRAAAPVATAPVVPPPAVAVRPQAPPTAPAAAAPPVVPAESAAPARQEPSPRPSLRPSPRPGRPRTQKERPQAPSAPPAAAAVEKPAPPPVAPQPKKEPDVVVPALP